MEKNFKNSISVYGVLENCFRQFLEFEQWFCLGLLGNVSRDVYLPQYTIKLLLAICPDYFARMTTLYISCRE